MDQTQKAWLMPYLTEIGNKANHNSQGATEFKEILRKLNKTGHVRFIN